MNKQIFKHPDFITVEVVLTKLKYVELKQKVYNITSKRTYRIIHHNKVDDHVVIKDQFTGKELVTQIQFLRTISVKTQEGDIIELDKKVWESVIHKINNTIEVVVRLIPRMNLDDVQIAFLKKEKNFVYDGYVIQSSQDGRFVLIDIKGNEYEMIENQVEKNLESNPRPRPVNFYVQERDGVVYGVIVKSNFKKWTDSDLYNAFKAGERRKEVEMCLFDVQDLIEANKTTPSFKQWKINYENEKRSEIEGNKFD
jgi:hypothetical protein